MAETYPPGIRPRPHRDRHYLQHRSVTLFVEGTMDGIGHFVHRLRGKYAQFDWLLKHTLPLPSYTRSNSFGVRFGVRDMRLLMQLFVMKPP